MEEMQDTLNCLFLCHLMNIMVQGLPSVLSLGNYLCVTFQGIFFFQYDWGTDVADLEFLCGWEDCFILSLVIDLK